MKKAFIFGLMAVLLVATIYAVKPGVSSSTTTANGLIITYPLFDFVKQYEMFKFNFHVYDSNFSELDNISVSCYAHIYNKSGLSLVEIDYIPMDSNLDDFWINYTFNQTGVYSYLVWCNSTLNEGGVIEQPFTVTATGEAFNEYAAIILFIVALLPLAFGIVTYLSILSLNDEHPALKWFGFLFLPISYIATLHAAILVIIRYMNFAAMQDYIGDLTYWVYLLFFGLLSYVCIYFIVKAFRTAAQEKKDRIEY